ncbi:MAG TPA: hypothetical protein VK184_17290 [Nostocaceae cyanobacterium]|nr:hypothetical protein [Nostocaceae cyanobacterium]
MSQIQLLNKVYIKNHSKTTIYEIWRNEDGSLDFFPSTNDSARALLDDNAQLIKKIEANSWEEARQKQYEFLEWGNYQPLHDVESQDISTSEINQRGVFVYKVKLKAKSGDRYILNIHKKRTKLLKKIEHIIRTQYLKKIKL